MNIESPPLVASSLSPITSAAAPPSAGLSSERSAIARKLPESHLPSIDGLRAASICLVLVAHLRFSRGVPPILTTLIDHIELGSTGVRIFFVISGFLITFLMLREESRWSRVSLPQFYRRRAVRILPVYAVFLATVAALLATGCLREPLGTFAQPLTFTTGLWPKIPLFYGHLWSLAVEEQFYLLWPLVFVTSGPRVRFASIATVILIAPALRLGLHLAHAYQMNAFSILGNGDALAWGCLLAILVERRQAWVDRVVAWRPSVGRAASLVALVGIGAAEVTPGLQVITLPFGRSVQAIAAAYLIASLTRYRSGTVYWLVNIAPFVVLGTISYSAYIWQQIFLLHNSFDLRVHRWQCWPYNLPLALAVAACSYYFVERPLFRFKRPRVSTMRDISDAAVA